MILYIKLKLYAQCKHCVFSLSRHMPGHASREILVLFGSLTSCDPGDILDTIQVMMVKVTVLDYYDLSSCRILNN